MVAMNSGYVNHLEGKRPTIAQEAQARGGDDAGS